MLVNCCDHSSFSAFVEHRLEVLYGPIRYKMALALNNWHPSDSSAHKILEPWVKVSVADFEHVWSNGSSV